MISWGMTSGTMVLTKNIYLQYYIVTKCETFYENSINENANFVKGDKNKVILSKIL